MFKKSYLLSLSELKTIEIMIRNFIFCFALLLGAFSYAQLPGFTLEAETTAETCFQNGTITVTVEGIAPGAAVDYVLYMLPDEDTPLPVTGNGETFTFSGLANGAYKVVATQSLGGDTSVEEETVVVANEFNQVNSSHIHIEDYILCGDDGELTVTMLLGVAEQYQLLTFPGQDIIVDWQESNVFTGLFQGEYLVRVDIGCDIIPRQYNLSTPTLDDVQFLGYEIGANFGPDCSASQVTILQDLLVPQDAFPITVTFTVYPPDGGAPYVVTQEVESPGGGDPAEFTVIQNVPYFEGMYFFDIHVTNACGTLYSFSQEDQPIMIELEASAILAEDLCYGIQVTTMNFNGGYYTIEFLEYPEGFIPHFPPMIDDPEGMSYGDQFTHIDPMTGESVVKFGIYDLMVPDDDGKPMLVLFDTVSGEPILDQNGDYINGGMIDSEEYEFLGVTVSIFALHNADGDPVLDNNGLYITFDMITPGGYQFLPIVVGGETIYVLHNPDGNLVLDNGEYIEADDFNDPDQYSFIDIDAVLEVLHDENGVVILDENGDFILESTVTYNEKISVMSGDYVIRVMDGCGFYVDIDLYIKEEIELTDDDFQMVPLAPVPFLSDGFLDCAARGMVGVSHPDVHFAYAEIISGPADFDHFLAEYTDHPPLATEPLDISAGIEGKMLGFAGPLSDDPLYQEITGVVGLGMYEIRVIDICGNEFILEKELEPFASGANAFSINHAPGCDNLSSIQIIPSVDDTAGDITSILILDAPEAFYTSDLFASLGGAEAPDENGDMYPEALSYAYWVEGENPGDPGQWYVVIPGLPPGDYIIDVKISCIGTALPITVPQYYTDAEFTQFDQPCGSFHFMFETESNSNTLIGPTTYVLQRSDDEGATWYDITPVAPDTLVENVTTPVNETGLFRIVKTYPRYNNAPNNGPHGPGGPGSGSAAPSPITVNCTDVIMEFEVYSEAGIEEVYSFACPDGGNEVIVEAVGPGTLTYFIVDPSLDETDPNYIIIENGESNVFSGLQPGTYTFRVDDSCGGSVTAVHQVGEPITFEVAEHNLCEGEAGYLSVQNFSFFSYEWYKVDEDGNEVLVGTGNQLDFDPFEADVDGGDYFVRIIFEGATTTCANQDIPHEVTIELPNAGEDNSRDFCLTDENQEIDLFSIFESDYDAGGTWEEIDTTGALNGNIFNTEDIDFGTYTFRYVVDTACFGSDEAIITVNLLDVPNAPQVLPVDEVCVGGDLDVSIDDVNAQYTYTWTLPNGNTYVGAVVPLTDVTTTDAGTYSVVASLGDCESDPTTVTVTVNPIADFTINSDRGICTTLTVVGSNFTTSEATYVWTFGGSEVGTGASITVDEIGEYWVEVTLNGCISALSETISVPDVAIDFGCVENQYMLTVLNAEDFPNSTFEWTGPNYSGEGSSVDISGEEDGDYTVTITDSEGCTVSMPVEVDGTQCMIPKGVSPNGDGLNDSFDLSNFSDVNEVKIFNRYGVMVYEKTDGYVDEWYGQTNNSDKLLPTATYYYIVSFLDGTKKTGWVYLNRDE